MRSTAVAFAPAFLLVSCAQHQPPPPKPPPPSSSPVASDQPVVGDKTNPEPNRPLVPPPPQQKAPFREVPRSAATETAPPVAAQAGVKDLFPHIRADIAAKVLEFDGIVPIDCHDPATPQVFLEVTVCTPDTKEHESLVMTKARPSDVHAALLAMGLKPGKPGSWDYQDKKLIAIAPAGDPLAVTIAYRDASGKEVEAPASAWVKMADTGAPFVPKIPGPQWLFAGSVITTREGREVYDADGAGVLIGLTTFGSEVIAWVDTLSPESSVQEPDWIADASKVPAAGTPVVVRIRPAK